MQDTATFFSCTWTFQPHYPFTCSAEHIATASRGAAEDRIDHQAMHEQQAREAALGKAAARADDLPGALVDRLLAGENAIRIWREHPSHRLSTLAAMAGVYVSYLSKVESGRKPGSAAARHAIAGALRVPMEDLA